MAFAGHEPRVRTDATNTIMKVNLIGNFMARPEWRNGLSTTENARTVPNTMALKAFDYQRLLGPFGAMLANCNDRAFQEG